MADPNTADMASPSYHRPRFKRAAIACEYCHQRKTRCDMTHGVPCTNCRLDKVHCFKRVPKNTSARKARGKCQKQDSDGPAHLAYGLTPGREQVSNTSARLPASPSAMTNVPTANMNRLPFVYYAFLDGSHIGHLAEGAVLMLESQGCFQLPSRPVVETLVSHYFLYVHPTLPLVDEGRFWIMYRQADLHKGQIPLLLFKAMLFAAVPFVPEYIAEECGFPSLVAARDEFYRKANMLYTHMCDNDHITIAQSALLLSYYNSNGDAMCNSTWLSIAIQHAQAENAHLFDSLASVNDQSRAMLKRLWWCCILRDRIISLGMRRSLQIKADQFNTVGTSIRLADMQDELGGSEVYQADMKLALTWVLIRLCNFASAVTQLLWILYPSFPGSEWGWNYTPEAHWEALQRASSSLSAWEIDFAQGINDDSTSQSRSSVTLFVKLTSVYHQAARIALCNHACQLADKLERPLTNIDLQYYKSELQDAVTTMTDQLRQLIAANMAKYLPVSTMAYTVLPLILWGLNLSLSSTPTARHRNAQQLSPFTEVNRLYSRKYDVKRLSMMVDRAVQFTKPNVLKLGCSMGKVGQAVSFVDIFEQEPGSYAGLCLYLDSLLSGQARARQTRGQRLNSVMSAQQHAQQHPQPQPQPQPPQSLPEFPQSTAISDQDIPPTLTNSDNHGNNVSLSSVLLTVHLNQCIPGMLHGLDCEPNQPMMSVDSHLDGMTRITELEAGLQEQSRGDCLDYSQFMDAFAMLGE